MIVTVTAEAVDIQEPDDCGSLRVASTLALADIDRILRNTGAGTLLGEGHILLDIASLHTAARKAAESPDWDANWSRMLDYATARGWVFDDGRTVRAHLDGAP